MAVFGVTENIMKKITLTDKELWRRIKLTKPFTVKRAYYGLIFVARNTGIHIKELNNGK